MSDLLGFVSQPLDQSFGIIEGEGAVLISAPHGCINNRPTINALHVPDDNTGALAMEIGRLTGAHVIYGTYTVDDANFYHWIPDPGDSDYYTPAYQPYIGKLLPYKERLKTYLENHPEIKFVIDYHGANYKRYFAVDLGFRGDRNIPGDNVGPFGDDEYPNYSFDDAVESPEIYTPSLRTPWGKNNILDIIVDKMTDAGIGGDITDWPEAHCDEEWIPGDTWNTSYSQDIGGWDTNGDGVTDTQEDCSMNWLDFYQGGGGSTIDFNNCCHSECVNGDALEEQECVECLDGAEYDTECISNIMPLGGITLHRYFTAKKRPTVTNYITRHDEADNIIDDPNYAGHRGWLDDVAMTGEIDAVQLEWSRVYRTIEPSTMYKYTDGEDLGVGNGSSYCIKTNGCNRASTAKNIKSVVEIVKAVNSNYGFVNLEDEALRGTQADYNTRITEAVDNSWKIQQNIFEGIINYPLDETVEESNNPSNPGSDRYWKNIIPDYYDIDYREGIYTYYNLTDETHERLNGSPICGTQTAAVNSGEECVDTYPVVGLTLPQNFDLFYVWFDDPEYSWEHKTEITIRDDGSLTTTAGVLGTWSLGADTEKPNQLKIVYSSGTTFTGDIDFNTASVPRYNEDGSLNTLSVDFTGREGYFVIPDLEFGQTLDFVTDYGYKTVNRTDGTIFWPLENLEVGSELFNMIFGDSSIYEIRGMENGEIVNIVNGGGGTWSGDLQQLYKNSYYTIVCAQGIVELKLKIPSIEVDGNGIVTNNFEIDEDHSQEWLGKNEYDNIYYYPVLPKLNKFGHFGDELGLQQGSYNPFQFEPDIDLIIDGDDDSETLSGEYYVITQFNGGQCTSVIDGSHNTQTDSGGILYYDCYHTGHIDDTEVCGEDECITPENCASYQFGGDIGNWSCSVWSPCDSENTLWGGGTSTYNGYVCQYTAPVEEEVLPDIQYSNIVKIPFGSPNRNWFDDDMDANVTNDNFQHKDKLIDLNYKSIDDNQIEDSAGMGNFGEMLGDYLIEYDYWTREPSTSGIKNVNIYQASDKKNTKRNY
jgi:hypothetical protein